MCGIAGITRVHPPGSDIPPPEVAIPEAWLDILDESIKHRGPDGQGRFRDRMVRADGSVVDVAFVHRRLSIIDLADGAQPMVSAGRSDAAQRPSGAATVRERGLFRGLPLPVLFQGRPDDAVAYRSIERARADLVTVVFNGCIYNHRELRQELQSLGHSFDSDHSDTEVLLHAYRRWGEDFPSRLRGMFALCIWDRAAGETLAARDLAGEKPLYEAVLPHGAYVFASTHAAVHRVLMAINRAVPGSATDELALWPRGIAAWLRHGASIIGPVAGIDEVEARITSRFCRLDRGDGEMVEATSRAWYMDLPQRGGASVTVESVDSAIGRAVESCLEADVPLGFFLSGGVDSSLVALHARRRTATARTFCVRMPDDRYDESRAAAEVARIIGSGHETLDCDARPAEQLVALIEQLGLPFGDSSLLPTHWVSTAARREVKVAVSGDGGDEVFCGYERHRAWRTIGRFRAAAALSPAWLDRGAHPKSARAKVARLRSASRSGYPELTAIFGLDRLEAVMPSVDRAWYPPRFSVDAAHHDFENYLPDDLMRKSDTASMAVALEVRAPLLTREIAEIGLAAPLDSLMPNGQRKGLLRAVARQYFPAYIVDRPKMGFAIPIAEWFRSDYGQMRQLLLDHLTGPEPFGPDSLGINGMINMAFVRQMLREHDAAGEKSLWPWKGRDHSQRLYMLLVLSIWAKWLAGLKRAGG